MKLRGGCCACSDDFWYDLTSGGYLNPKNICENEEDANRVIAAIAVLKEFENSCLEQIPDFAQ